MFKIELMLKVNESLKLIYSYLANATIRNVKEVRHLCLINAALLSVFTTGVNEQQTTK